MSSRGRRDKMKNREKRRALTLSKAMFTFGKISKQIYEERKRKNEITHTHTNTYKRTQNQIESNAHCVCDKRNKRD